MNRCMTLQRAGSLIKITYNRWSDHNAPRLGAALAYYALLSLSPLAMLLIAVSGFFLKESVAEQRILDQTQMLMGEQAALTLHGLIMNSQHRGSGLLATGIALITLIFGASGVFAELRVALNTIWDAPPPARTGWRGAMRGKLTSFVMVLGCGLFVMLSAIVTAVVAVAQKFASELVPEPAAIATEALNMGVSLVLLTICFAVIYKTVPTVAVAWRDAIVGALVTAVLFVIGRALLTLYLTKAAVGSAYGAAGSLVALIVWVYYSAQIFFFGAMFTRVYSEIERPRRAANSAAAVGESASDALK